MASNDSPRKLYVMRHAERVDFTFGSWIPSCFDEGGKYIRKNLNMPVSVPSRSGGPWDFFKDCPLTNIGLYQATLTGEAMKEHDIKFSHVFASPSLRCIETCTNVLKGSDQFHLPINVEPGLFEWLAWYHDGMPAWMTLDELKKIGFNISDNYSPVIPARDMTNTRESCVDYYTRSYIMTKQILEKFKDGNILFVAHAASLDTCTRQLVGHPPRDGHQFQNIVYGTPYCSVITVLQEISEQNWRLFPPPFPSLMHSSNMKFEWQNLVS